MEGEANEWLSSDNDISERRAAVWSYMAGHCLALRHASLPLGNAAQLHLMPHFLHSIVPIKGPAPRTLQGLLLAPVPDYPDHAPRWAGQAGRAADGSQTNL